MKFILNILDPLSIDLSLQLQITIFQLNGLLQLAYLAFDLFILLSEFLIFWLAIWQLFS